MANIEQLTQENNRLQLAINELKVLNDIATTISSTQPVEKIIDQIIVKCIKHLRVEEGTISLLERNSINRQFQTMIRRQDSSINKVPYKLDNRLTGWMLKNRTILLSNNIQEDDRFNFLREEALPFRSILSVPLLIKGDLIGYLAVFNKRNSDPFSDEDRRLLSIIGSQSAQVIENARLYEEEKKLISLREEMRMARRIQLNLLPDHIPVIPGIDVAAVNIPAESVGGDYYDFLPLASEKMGFCVGDISGKGMPAAMLMASLQATVRSQAVIFEDPSSCLAVTNKLLFRHTESNQFATLFYGIIDSNHGRLEYANGGHDAPLLFGKNGNPRLLNATGLLLGVLEDEIYSKATKPFEPGDLLVLYTDGITEAMDTENKEYGLDRLICLINDNRQKSTEQIKEIVLKDVARHADKASQSDDITLMLIKRVH